MIFQHELVKWYLLNKRDLPWRNTKDAYIIWLSEIILQQTRVDQGLPYFSRFVQFFPQVKDFASATETEVLKLWQGLGYYSRGRNMLHTAKMVMERHDGIFPSDYESLIKLKGIGPYTAAAISSFSSGEARAVVDGNVFRLISRYFGISTPIDTLEGKKAFAAMATALLVDQDPSIYNQAIMEFGAVICKPSAPKCAICPVARGCEALNQNIVSKLPVKQKKLEKKLRFFNYFLIIKNDQILMRHRGAGDIWQGLYDLPLIEQSEASLSADDVRATFGSNVGWNSLMALKHLLTHQTIFIQFFVMENFSGNFNECSGMQWVPLQDLAELPMPIVIHNFLETHLANAINK